MKWLFGGGIRAIHSSVRSFLSKTMQTLSSVWWCSFWSGWCSRWDDFKTIFNFAGYIFFIKLFLPFFSWAGLDRSEDCILARNCPSFFFLVLFFIIIKTTKRAAHCLLVMFTHLKKKRSCIYWNTHTHTLTIVTNNSYSCYILVYNIWIYKLTILLNSHNIQILFDQQFLSASPPYLFC